MTETRGGSNKLSQEEETVMLCVTVKRSQFDKVMRLGQGNRSKGARIAIDHIPDRPYNPAQREEQLDIFYEGEK